LQPILQKVSRTWLAILLSDSIAVVWPLEEQGKKEFKIEMPGLDGTAFVAFG